MVDFDNKVQNGLHIRTDREESLKVPYRTGNNLKEFLYNKVYIVKYEDFVNKPLFYLNEISKKFSLNANYENYHNIWQKTSTTVKTPYESDLWGKALNNSRVGVYKELLKKNEINEINLYCKEIINNSNY